MRVLKLCSTDPFANLAAERYLFENGDPEEELLLLYVNRPCVVIGRSQNPFRECDLRAMQRNGMPLVRRYTGGGTVYHDGGNLNFTLMRSRQTYDKYENSQAVLKALAPLGIAAEVTERNDLVASGRKFSGSAYRLTKERALHHGTLLVCADLPLLRSVLRPTMDGIEGKGVLSVSSPVVTLAELVPGLEFADVEKALVRGFAAGGLETIPADGPLYRESGTGAAELASWEWRFGRTPGFSFPLQVEGSEARVDVVNGKIAKISLPGAGELVGKKVDQLWNLDSLSVD